MRMLLIEDDDETADYVVRGMRALGHVIDRAADGQAGMALALDDNYEVLIIDRMLPKVGGLELLTMLRAGGNQTAAIFLTAVSSIDDRVQGLKIADDYLVKPFAMDELVARVSAIARRPRHAVRETVLHAGDLEFDAERRRVRRAGKTIDLRPTELRLLEFLLRNKGEVVTRTMLLEGVWDFNFDPKTNVVETHISRLRAKINEGFDCDLIQTVRGSGYVIDDPT